MTRETANTRMRDFYDIHVLTQQATIDYKVLHDAFMARHKMVRNTAAYSPKVAIFPLFGNIFGFFT